MTQPRGTPITGGGSILTRKTGPLANWVWMAIILLAALVFAMWRRNRAGADPNAVEEGPVEEVPGDQTAPPVFILPQNPQPTVPVNVTVNNPASPPTAPPVGSKPVTPLPSVQPKPSAPTKPAVAYDSVSVVKYVKGKAAWNSTLWGIAKAKGYGAASKNWVSIWDDPRNAALKKKRGTPENIRPGDVIYVRRK